MTFEEILRFFWERLGRVEASFSSKLLATVNPDMPVWDREVLKNLGLKPPLFHDRYRIAKTEKLYNAIIRWYSTYLKTERGKSQLLAFDQRFPQSGISDLKKIDLILWQTRENKEADQKASSTRLPEGRSEYKVREVHLVRPMKNDLGDFLEATVTQINNHGFGEFELNETVGYFSIQKAGRKRYKNVVCFVKNEPVISLNKYVNIVNLLSKPSLSKLRKRSSPPLALQLKMNPFILSIWITLWKLTKMLFLNCVLWLVRTSNRHFSAGQEA